MATGITHYAKETAELDLKKEVWSYSKGCLEERLRAEGAGAWKQTGDLGETLIHGVRGVTGGVLQGNH